MVVISKIWLQNPHQAHGNCAEWVQGTVLVEM